jgi:hypothetical protein
MRSILVVAALLAACSSTPPQPASPAPPPAAPAVHAVAPTDKPAEDKFATIDATNIAEAQKAGYKVVNENGQQLFCRRKPITGTRLKQKTTCLTAEQMREEANKARDAVTPSQIPAYTMESGR